MPIDLNKKRLDTYSKYKVESEDLFKQMMRENKGLRNIVKEAKLYHREYMKEWKELHPERIKQYIKKVKYNKNNKCLVCGRHITNESKYCNICKGTVKRKNYVVKSDEITYRPQGSSLPVPTVHDNSPKQ